MLIIINQDGFDGSADHNQHLIYRMVMNLHLRAHFHAVDEALDLIRQFRVEIIVHSQSWALLRFGGGVVDQCFV